jgi:hypothetical protein
MSFEAPAAAAPPAALPFGLVAIPATVAVDQSNTALTAEATPSYPHSKADRLAANHAHAPPPPYRSDAVRVDVSELHKHSTR